MNKQYEMVKEFQEKMNQGIGTYPRKLDLSRAGERFDYMQEELKEFYNARTTVDQVDAMIDLMYLALGTMVEIGVKPEEPFKIVHEANMTKLWEDGKPRIDDNGKIVKPPNFRRPEKYLEKEIARQARDYERLVGLR